MVLNNHQEFLHRHSIISHALHVHTHTHTDQTTTQGQVTIINLTQNIYIVLYYWRHQRRKESDEMSRDFPHMPHVRWCQYRIMHHRIIASW